MTDDERSRAVNVLCAIAFILNAVSFTTSGAAIWAWVVASWFFLAPAIVLFALRLRSRA